MIQINLGSLFSAQERWGEAERAFYRANSPFLRQSVDINRKARVNNNLGYVLFRQEKYEAAHEFLQIALQLWQQASDELEYANTLSTIADCYKAQGQNNTALILYDELLTLLANYPHGSELHHHQWDLRTTC